MEILLGLILLGIVIVHIIKEATTFVKVLKSSKKAILLNKGIKVDLLIAPINKNEAIPNQDNSSKNDNID